MTRLALAFLANILFSAGLFSHALLYNFYLDRLGLGAGTMGAAAAALAAGGMAALAPAGMAVDRLGMRAAYVGAALLAASGLAAGALVSRPAAIYAAAALAGAGTATWRVAMGPAILRLAPAPVRTRAFSWNVGLLVAAGAAWTAIAGALPDHLAALAGLDRLAALRAVLLVGAAATALAALTAVALPSRGVDAAHRLPGGLRGLRLPRTLVPLVGLVAVWMTASALVLPFFNLYFLRRFGLGLDRIGLVIAASQLLTAAIIFGSGEAAARLGPVRALAAWMLLFAPAIWTLAAITALGPAIGLYLLQGLVAPASNPLVDQVLLERAPPGREGAVSSWRNAATEASGFIGASGGGVLLEAGSFALLFGTAGAVGLAAALALIGALRPWARRGVA